MSLHYDFGGWATRNNLQCSDGRIIRQNAFIDNDGQTVPLVWNHEHNDPLNVLGHALLENRNEGVYAYCTFNDTEAGQAAKTLVKHGDVTALSIYANKLQHQGPNVVHGAIREVSLVLAGANPGACIDSVLSHGDIVSDEGVIYSGEEGEGLYLSHSMQAEPYPYDEDDYDDYYDYDDYDEGYDEYDDNYDYEGGDEDMPNLYHADEYDDYDDDEETVQDVLDSLTDKQAAVVYALIGEAAGADEDEMAQSAFYDEYLAHADFDEDETVQDVLDSLDDTQAAVVYSLIGEIAADSEDYEGDYDDDMKHNVFYDDDDYYGFGDTLSHSEEEAIFSDAKRFGSLKESALQHGIDNIEYLFPDAQTLNDAPDWLSRQDEWVKKVMDNVHHTPFARIKSMYADITEADARAKGYIKGNMKVEEVFALFKRTTDPQTVYKKQKLDRDDVVDITDFDVVAWLKTEMRMMLDEEIARAILVGDGRDNISEEKINEQHIRPIWTDHDVYTIKQAVNVSSSSTADQKAKAFIRACVKSRKEYKGSGTPTLFTTEDVLTDCLLMEDTTGRVIYDTEEKLRTALRVKEIVTVPVMEGLTRTDDEGKTHFLMGIIVNLQDYNVGADKGGSVSMFDDFDIDYNAQKYLIETRCSGALTKPYSAIAVELLYQLMIELEADSGTVLGKSVDDLQSDIRINGDHISGKLKYVTGYTGYSGDPEEQNGNFLALKFTATDGATTKIKLIGGTTPETTLDSDMEAVIRVTNKATQKLQVTTTLGGETLTKVFSLSSLRVENA